MVIVAKNPVHSVLFLILAFFSAAGLFVLLGAEFLAMLLVVVYVGAVAVLFLFVVMMLDVDFAELRRASSHARRSACSSAARAGRADPVFLGRGSARRRPAPWRRGAELGARSHQRRGDRAGALHHYVYFFQAAGLVLLVAMIGAIVLTLRHKPGVRRQAIVDQVARTPATGIEIVKMPSGGSRSRPRGAKLMIEAGAHDHRPRPLPGGRREPVHDRRASASS